MLTVGGDEQIHVAFVFGWEISSEKGIRASQMEKTWGHLWFSVCLAAQEHKLESYN